MDAQRAAERRIWLLRALLLTQVWLAVQGRVVAYTWLVETGNSALLAWVYMGQATAVALITLAMFGLIDRLGRASLLASLFAVFAAGVGLAGAVPSSHAALAAPLFLLFVEGGSAIVGSQFWLLASELLSPDQARRSFPSFALAGGLGAIGGGAAGHLMPLLGTRGMTLMLVAPAALACGITLVVGARYGYRVGPRHDATKASLGDELRTGVSLFRTSHLLRWVGVLTAAISCSSVAIDYLFTQSVAKSVATGGLAAFFGNINVAISVVQLAVAGLLGSRLFTTFGLFRTFTSYPVGAWLVALGAAPFGLATSAIVLKVFDRFEKDMILNPGMSIALAAFPRARRGRASLIFAGLVKPLAMVAAGGSLVLLQASAAALWLFIAVTLTAFFPLLRKLAAVYRDALLENLKTNDVRLVTSSIEALAEPENRSVVPRLVELLEGSEDPVVCENVLRAAGSIGDLRFVPFLLYALGSDNSSMKIAAAGSLRRFWTPEVQQAVIAALRSEQSARVKASLIAALGAEQAALHPILRAGLTDDDPRVRANAVEAIGLSQDPALLAELRPLLDSGSPRELANVVVALARVPQHRPAALAALQRIFESPERTLLASALWAVGETGAAQFLPILRHCASDPQAIVRRNAIISMGKLAQPEAIVPMVQLMLGARDDSFAMARALGRLDSRQREAVIMHLSRVSREQRAPALFALAHCGLNYPDELDQLA